jgi:hypothetical protein
MALGKEYGICQQVLSRIVTGKTWKQVLKPPYVLTASKLTFADPEKVREVARQGEAMGTSEARTDVGIWNRSRQGRPLPKADA